MRCLFCTPADNVIHAKRNGVFSEFTKRSNRVKLSHVTVDEQKYQQKCGVEIAEKLSANESRWFTSRLSFAEMAVRCVNWLANRASGSDIDTSAHKHQSAVDTVEMEETAARPPPSHRSDFLRWQNFFSIFQSSHIFNGSAIDSPPAHMHSAYCTHSGMKAV